MSEFKTLPKPIKQERKDSWGVKRKYSKPKKFKKDLPKFERKILISPLFTEDDPAEYEFLFTEYYPGIAKISPELYIKVKTRSKVCEICGKRPALFIHHLLIGRLRISWSGNLLNLCAECHDKDGSRDAIHHNADVYEKAMKKLQSLYFDIGFNQEQVKWLLGTKSGRLF